MGPELEKKERTAGETDRIQDHELFYIPVRVVSSPYVHDIVCETCGGTGSEWSEGYSVECPDCDGAGAY